MAEIRICYDIISRPASPAMKKKDVGSFLYGDSAVEIATEPYLGRLRIEGTSNSLSQVARIEWISRGNQVMPEQRSIWKNDGQRNFDFEIQTYSDFDLDFTVFWQDGTKSLPAPLKINVKEGNNFVDIRKQ